LWVMKMSRPFDMEIGFTKAEIANIVQFLDLLRRYVEGSLADISKN
jgi:hypothetical protein